MARWRKKAVPQLLPRWRKKHLGLAKPEKGEEKRIFNSYFYAWSIVI
jgi:hypothetical protein